MKTPEARVLLPRTVMGRARRYQLHRRARSSARGDLHARSRSTQLSCQSSSWCPAAGAIGRRAGQQASKRVVSWWRRAEGLCRRRRGACDWPGSSLLCVTGRASVTARSSPHGHRLTSRVHIPLQFLAIRSRLTNLSTPQTLPCQPAGVHQHVEVGRCGCCKLCIQGSARSHASILTLAMDGALDRGARSRLRWRLLLVKAASESTGIPRDLNVDLS
jgi:hypothetical protein